MIIRKKHPTDPGKHTYSPRAYSSEHDSWVPTKSEERIFDDPIDAGRECLEHLRRVWTVVLREARILRALCEHPGFDFDADGVSSDLIRAKATDLVMLSGAMDVDLECLLEFRDDGQVPKSRFTAQQLDDIKRGKAAITDYSWHHHQDPGRMQLVPRKYHVQSQHIGGYKMWPRPEKRK